MSVNSSLNSSDSSLHAFLNDCSESRPSTFIFTAFTIINILLLPLFIFVLYVGYQRWRKPRFVSTTVTNHSDVFTYNVVFMEMVSVLGCCLFSSGSLAGIKSMILVALDMFSITSPGQILFHLLTCVERYLAVVHPITYLGLRQSGGVRIRNISVACVWLICFGWFGISKVLVASFNSIATSCLLVFSIISVSFCSLSVLCVLIRPGPGDMGGDRERVDQTKRRGFYNITAIMGALMLRFVGILVSVMMSSYVQTHTVCMVVFSGLWLTLPSSLVLPLLFLHRAGKLPGCKHSTESG
ncbi:uncharacterized protein LOC121177396 [Lates japonicus]